MTNKTVEPSILIREFDAPRQLVYDAWTNIEHLNNWMFPMPGCTCEYVSADITSGGTSLHKVTMNNGNEMWLFTQYEEVTAPEKLVFLQYMSNQNGDILHMSHMPNWPKHMLATVIFETLTNERTKLTFYWEPQNPSELEIEAFENSREQHGRGWGAGLAQLHTYLSNLTSGVSV